MPFDKSRYPANWKAISLRIRERDGWQCKWCGVPNNAVIRRLEDGMYTYYGQYTTKDEWDRKWARATPKLIRVVLTVAHLGVPYPDGTPGNKHDKMDVRDENLAPLCNRCHLRYDRDEHVHNAAITRRRKKILTGQNSFLDDPDDFVGTLPKLHMGHACGEGTQHPQTDITGREVFVTTLGEQ